MVQCAAAFCSMVHFVSLFCSVLLRVTKLQRGRRGSLVPRERERLLLLNNYCMSTGSFRNIKLSFLTQPASFQAHTDEARTQSASVVSINHTETANQPASFYNLRRKSNFVARNFMNHQENHTENHQIFHNENVRFSQRKLSFSQRKSQIIKKLPKSLPAGF